MIGLAADPFFPLLKLAVIKATGMQIFADRDDELAEVIGRRLQAVGTDDCAAYYQLVTDPQEGRAERDELANELTIGETYFFRHRELFDAIRDVVLPDVIARNQDRRCIRIWSAGCATGAEPYSIAIMLRREFAAALEGWRVQIIGTDINNKFLAIAKRAKYGDWALRATPEMERSLYFIPDHDHHWTLRPEYRQNVSFHAHNLAEDPFPSIADDLFDIDIIICRNVTIYFAEGLVGTVIAAFRECLVNGGWLLPGHAEAGVELFKTFRTVNVPGAVIFQKAAVGDALAEPGAGNGESAVAAALRMPIEHWSPPAGSASDSADAAADPAPAAQPAAGAVDSLTALGRHVDRGEWRYALEVAAVMQDEMSDRPAFFLYQALAEQALGRIADARSSLQKAIFIDRHYALAHYYLGVLLREQGETDVAARAFSNAAAVAARAPADDMVAEVEGLTFGRLREMAEAQLRTTAHDG